MLLNLKGLQGRVQYFFSHPHGTAGVGVGQQQNEFVPAQARHGVLLSHLLAKPLRQLHQHLVADVVTERVVDVFKVIQVHEHQGSRLTVALRTA